MGFNYIVLLWVLWTLHAPWWVWAVLAASYVIDRIIYMLEQKAGKT